MRRLGRTVRVLKWGGLVLSLVTLVLWAVSARWGVTYWGSTAALSCGRGGLSVLTYTVGVGLPYHGWRIGTGLGLRGASYRIYHSTTQASYYLYVPFWIPFLLVAIPAALFGWLDRRRIPPGHCQRCGYDLTGNTSGTCPECGAPVPNLETKGEAHVQP